MKLKIAGVEYEPVSFESASPLLLMELQSQSRRLVEGGLGMSRLSLMERDSTAYRRARQAWQDAGADPDQEPPPPDDSPIAIAVLMFLSRRAVGEKVTFEEAASTPMSEFEAIPDASDVDDAEAEDPQQPVPDIRATPDVDQQAPAA